MLQKHFNKFFIASMLLFAGCGGSDYGGGTTTYPDGTSPVQTSSVQEVQNCSDVVHSASIEVRANTFLPGSGTITRGQIVNFENFDPETHTVTGGGPNTPNNMFDITLSAFGEQNSERCLKFTEPGTFGYFDKLHPLSTGEIVVQ